MPGGSREHFHKMVASFEEEINRIKFPYFPFFVKKKSLLKGREREIPPSVSILFLYRFFGIIGE